MNKKKTSKKLASQAGATLNDPNASKIKKSMAAGALAQADPSKQTSKEMEKKASDVLKSDKFSEETKSFAASIMSQSNKER
jgi:hypothetical protein